MISIILWYRLLLSLGETAVGQTRTLNVGDAIISYDLTGKGKTVVFIHGWAHNKSAWDDQVPVFSKRYRVLRYDSPGFGASTGFADASAEPVDLQILLEALSTITALSALTGGEIALSFAPLPGAGGRRSVIYGATPTSRRSLLQVCQMFGSFPRSGEAVCLDTVGKLITEFTRMGATGRTM